MGGGTELDKLALPQVEVIVSLPVANPPEGERGRREIGLQGVEQIVLLAEAGEEIGQLLRIEPRFLVQVCDPIHQGLWRLAQTGYCHRVIAGLLWRIRRDKDPLSCSRSGNIRPFR